MKGNAVTIVVIILIAIIVFLYIFPHWGSDVAPPKQKITQSKFGIVQHALVEFLINCGRLPTQSEGLDALLVPPEELKEKWGSRPYVKESELLDAWGNRFIYTVDQTVIEGFVLMSYGADGELGGDGENMDIIAD